MTELSFHGMVFFAPFAGQSVTHVSGTFCYLCLGTVMVAWVGSEAVRLERCEEEQREPAAKVKRPVKRFIPPPGQSHWMKGFRVEGNPAWKAWREEQAAAVSARLRSPSGLPSPG